jgi:hypothetical protein
MRLELTELLSIYSVWCSLQAEAAFTTVIRLTPRSLPNVRQAETVEDKAGVCKTLCQHPFDAA